MTTPLTAPVNAPTGDITQQGQPPVTVNVTPPATPNVQYFTAEQLEAARQQEKDKVYGRLNSAEQQRDAFKTEVETLRAKQAEIDAEAARRQAEADEAARRSAEEKMSAAELIAAKERDMLARQQDFEQRMMLKQAELEKEQQFLSLRDFTSRRVNEEIAQDNIAPEFLDYITGNSEEEIEASITKAKEKTASIAAQVNPQGLRLPGVSPTGFGPTGPLEQFMGQQQEPTPEQINAMSMDEYAAYRRARGMDKAGQGRGLFG